MILIISNLAKNSELKDIVLNETPWVNDADSETEQRRMLATFFDENLIGNRKQSAIEKLAKLQKVDGSWSWMPGMDGSSYITTSVAEMLVRVNAMTGKQKETAAMLGKALRWLDKNAVKEVEEMKRNQKTDKRHHHNAHMDRLVPVFLHKHLRTAPAIRRFQAASATRRQAESGGNGGTSPGTERPSADRL